jgi:hypothetical protein
MNQFCVVVANGNELFTGVNDTDDKSSPVSLLPAKIISGVVVTGD